jgi:hypothetical protein
MNTPEQSADQKTRITIGDVLTMLMALLVFGILVQSRPEPLND